MNKRIQPIICVCVFNKTIRNWCLQATEEPKKAIINLFPHTYPGSFQITVTSATMKKKRT